MSIFLSYIDFIQKLQSDQVNELSKCARIQKYAKG
jgi:hypothetical protein